MGRKTDWYPMSSVAHHLNSAGWKYLTYFVLSPRHNRVWWGTSDASVGSGKRTLQFETEELMCANAVQGDRQRTCVVRGSHVRTIAARLGKQLDDFDMLECVNSE